MSGTLTIDAGNSHMTLALYDERRELRATRRIHTRPFRTAPQLIACWTAMLTDHDLQPPQVHLAISSVVPDYNILLKDAGKSMEVGSFHWVDVDSPHGFRMLDSVRKEIGADLIAGLVGARSKTSGPLVVVDAGTATTFTLLSAADEILGVAILPGIKTQIKMLMEKAPHLADSVHAKELLTFFIAFELLSIPLYMLAGFRRYHRKSAEAGLKYFLSGALSSALFLFGASWVYGACGSTLYIDLPLGMGPHVQPMVMGLLLILAAFGFKLSAAPFHMWAPDTYEGAPIPIAAFLSSVPKAVMFAAAIRLFGTVAPLMHIELMMVLSALSVLSIMLGNLVALTQCEVTRLAAYSGIAQVGYLLIGLSAVMFTSSPEQKAFAVTSMGALLFYLLVYTVTNMAFWMIILTVGKARGRTDLDAFDGLAESSPFLAFALMICAMSLAGVPPLAGFVGKLYLFRAAAYVQPTMAVFGVFGSVLSLVYYFGILRRCYFLKPPAEAQPFRLAGSTQGLLSALLVLAAVGGMVPQIADTCMQIALRIIP